MLRTGTRLGIHRKVRRKFLALSSLERKVPGASRRCRSVMPSLGVRELPTRLARRPSARVLNGAYYE
jgi:hypothetical protein